MKNLLDLKIINELSEYNFYIPAYQRGYRWTKEEVSDLLNDIHNFTPKEIPNTNNDATWYCLQPIVIKKRDDTSFEVIDGQQRLTTIYLILYYLNQDYVESRQAKLFSIGYETRAKSKEFLLNPAKEDTSNIDFFYIHKAYITIQEWFEKQGLQFDKNGFQSKFNFNTKVILYETKEDDPIQVFTRLNIGKISLSNAELIKALFLNSDNFKNEDSHHLQRHQIEIATEWDTIENSLQNPKLWYFLSDKEVDNNRIEYIFNLMSNHDTDTTNEDGSDKNRYATFKYFFDNIAKNKTTENIQKHWEEVQSYFQRFNEWFHDRNLYHLIGFILTAKIKTMKDIYKECLKRDKKNFYEWLEESIRWHYREIAILDLDYENKHVKDILLLYNILTMLQNEHNSSYFPFNIFKQQKWNIEHITSIKDAIPEEKHRHSWLDDVSHYIDTKEAGGENLFKQIEIYLQDNKSTPNSKDDSQNFEKLFISIIDYFNTDIHQEEQDYISNLALLDENTNKSYKNAIFPIKRKTIIEKDKRGDFIPICTKNIFLKYFTDYPPKISLWTEDDREKYKEDLIHILGKYLAVSNEKK